MPGRAASNSYAALANYGASADRWRALGTGTMSTITCNDELPGTAARQKLSPGPRVSSASEQAVMSFQRPGPEVVSRAIPVVFIGHNRDGVWVARDADGKFGGLFWRKGAALRFAKANAGPAGCAAVFPQARFELDIENGGNRFLGCLGIVTRRLLRPDDRAQLPIRASREGLMRGFFRFAVTIFLSTALLAGIIALKTGIYLTRLTH